MPKLKELLTISGADYKALKGKDLREAVSSLRSTARKRAERLDAKGYNTQALTMLERSGGLPTIKGMSDKELKREFMRYRSFLTNQTSTISGFKEFRSDVINGLASQGVHINEEDFAKFWETYEKLKEMSPEVENRRLKYKSMRELANLVQEGTLDFEGLILQMQEEIEALYEAEEVEDDGVSSFFEGDF